MQDRCRPLIARAPTLCTIALALMPLCASAFDEPLRIYAAGSMVAPLKEAISASGLAAEAVAPPVFGPAGLLRQRLERGEAADLFLSADLAQPQALVASRRATMVVPFARNHLCLLSRKSLDVAVDAVVDGMLDPATRLATSTPQADPGGDYAWKVFEKAEAVRPGARAALQSKALQLIGSPSAMTPVAGKTASASVFLTDKADALIYYCSGQADTLRDVPGLVSNRLPAKIDVTAVYGIAVMTDRPDALRFALFLLSDKGQAILALHGLVPLASSDDLPP